MQEFCFSVVLWGQPFVDLFTRYVLPSHLAPDNIPALTLNGRSHYLIVTTAADMERMDATPAIRRLKEYMPVKFVLASFGDTDIRSDLKYRWMTEANRYVLDYARERDAGVWFLTPDTLLANGALRRVERGVLAGRRAVVVTGLMADQIGFLPDLHALLDRDGGGADLDGGTLAIAPRPLMSLWSRHPHHIVDAYFHDSTRFNHFPSFIFWRLGAEGLLARCFHLHPIFIHPDTWEGIDGSRTIDQTYVAHAVRDPGDVDVPTDSDEFLLIEIAPPEKRYPVYDRSFAVPRRIGAWAARETELLNWIFFRQKLWFHTGIDRTRFADVEQMSDRFVDEVLRNAAMARAAAQPRPAPAPC